MNAATPFFRDGRTFPTETQLNGAISELAELLSLDMPLAEIAARMSITVGSVCALLRMLCERMGEQAR